MISGTYSEQCICARFLWKRFIFRLRSDRGAREGGFALVLANPSPFAFNLALHTSHFLEWADSISETIIAILPWNCPWERICYIIPRPSQRSLAFLRPGRSLRFPTQSAWLSDDLLEGNRSRFL